MNNFTKTFEKIKQIVRIPRVYRDLHDHIMINNDDPKNKGKLTKKYFNVEGGRGSGKTTVIAIIVCLYLIANPNTGAIIFRVDATSGETFLNEIETILSQWEHVTGQKLYNKINRTPANKRVLFTNGSQIKFSTMTSRNKVSGANINNGKVKLVVFEEAGEFINAEDMFKTAKGTFDRTNCSYIFVYNPTTDPRSITKSMKSIFSDQDKWYDIKTIFLDLIGSTRVMFTEDGEQIEVPIISDEFLAEKKREMFENPIDFRTEWLGDVGDSSDFAFPKIIKYKPNTRPDTFDYNKKIFPYHYGKTTAKFLSIDFGEKDGTGVVEFSFIGSSVPNTDGVSTVTWAATKSWYYDPKTSKEGKLTFDQMAEKIIRIFDLEEKQHEYFACMIDEKSNKLFLGAEFESRGIFNGRVGSVYDMTVHKNRVDTYKSTQSCLSKEQVVLIDIPNLKNSYIGVLEKQLKNSITKKHAGGEFMLQKQKTARNPENHDHMRDAFTYGCHFITTQLNQQAKINEIRNWTIKEIWEGIRLR